MNAAEAKLLSKLIPGFGDYAAEQQRRDDDLALRRYLIDRLQESKGILQGAAQQWMSPINFDAIRGSESLRTSIETLQSKLRAAPEGYSAWFSQSKVDEKKLKEVLDLDRAIVGFIDKLDESLKGIQKEFPKFEEATELVARATERFSRRHEILNSH